MALHRTAVPIDKFKGTLPRDRQRRALRLEEHKRQAPYTARAAADPAAPGPEVNPMTKPHKLSGPLHTEQTLTVGHFLKAIGSTAFAWAAHGLTWLDVGAAPADQGVTGGDAHWHSKLAAPDGTPDDAVRVNANGFVGIRRDPYYQFEVEAPTSRFNNAPTNLRLVLDNTPGDEKITLQISSGARFRVRDGGGHEILTVTEANRVGVNKPTPAQALNVTGNIQWTGALLGPSISNGNPFGRYHGRLAANPIDPWQDGDYYIHTAANTLRVYDHASTTWYAFAAA